MGNLGGWSNGNSFSNGDSMALGQVLNTEPKLLFRPSMIVERMHGM